MPKAPKKTAGDVAHAVVKTALAVIPGVGGPAAELFNQVIAPPLDRRRNEWLTSLAERIEQLRARIDGFNMEDLANNESFVTAVLQATRVAIQTHHEEKLEALRNAVLNSALPNSPDDHIQALFINYLEAMTPWHLRILAWLQDPDEWAKRHNVGRHNLATVNFGQLLPIDFPELKGQGAFYLQIVSDLRGRGLITEDTSSQTAMGRDMHGPRTASLGDRFLEYVAEPLIR